MDIVLRILAMIGAAVMATVILGASGLLAGLAERLAVEPKCACLQYIGDNPDCPVHEDLEEAFRGEPRSRSSSSTSPFHSDSETRSGLH